MNDMVLLQRGKPFPYPLPETEGAISDFLRPHGNTLLVLLPNMTKAEIKAIRTGPLDMTLLTHDNEMLFLWRTKTSVFDTPFDARLIPDFEPSRDPRVFVVGVDSATKMVVALRSITMPQSIADLMLLTSIRQREHPNTKSPVPNAWTILSPEQLTRRTVMYRMGLE